MGGEAVDFTAAAHNTPKNPTYALSRIHDSIVAEKAFRAYFPFMQKDGLNKISGFIKEEVLNGPDTKFPDKTHHRDQAEC